MSHSVSASLQSCREAFCSIFLKPKLRRLLSEAFDGDYDRIILIPSVSPDDAECFRLRQLAAALSSKHCLVFCPPELFGHKRLSILRRKDNLYLFTSELSGLKTLFREELGRRYEPCYLLFSSDAQPSEEPLQFFSEREFRRICDVSIPQQEQDAGFSDALTELLSDRSVFFTTDSRRILDRLIVFRGTSRLLQLPPAVNARFMRKKDPGFQFDREFEQIRSAGLPVVLCCEDPRVPLDWDLITGLAESGKYSLVLFRSPSLSPSGEHLYYLGQRDESVLRYYAGACDLILFPFAEGNPPFCPVHIYDALALGLPVIVSGNPFCSSIPGVVTASSGDILLLLEQTLSSDGEERSRQAERTVRENDWLCRAEALCSMLSSHES